MNRQWLAFSADLVKDQRADLPPGDETGCIRRVFVGIKIILQQASVDGEGTEGTDRYADSPESVKSFRAQKRIHEVADIGKNI